MFRKTNSRSAYVTAAFALTLAGKAWAQNGTASITGLVTDPTGAAVAKAEVIVEDQATHVQHRAVSNEKGNYSILLLPPGHVQLTVRSSGFETQQKSGILLEVDKDAQYDFKLSVGSEAQIVSVVAGQQMLDTETNSSGTVIEPEKMTQLPLNSRTFYTLAYLIPGVLPPAQNSTLGYRGGFNVAGATEASNNFVLDGFDNNDEQINAPSFRPSIDAILEFKVLTGLYNASYGRDAGGQVLVSLRSGTNAIHGTAYEYIRNQVVDARNYFQNTGVNPAFRRNQFGGTVGGPIRKDKTFFFFGYEGLRSAQAVSANTTVPLQAEIQNGDFSSLLKLAKPIQLVNPITKVPYLNNQLTGISSIGKALASYFPAPTSATPTGIAPANNYAFSETRPENSDQYSLRVDNTFSEKDSVYAEYNFYNDFAFEPSNSTCGARLVPGFGCNSGLTTQLMGISYTHSFTPAVINNFRIGYNRYEQSRLQQDSNINFAQQYGIANVSDGTIPTNIGVPTVTATGFAALGGASNLPQDLINNGFQWSDQVIWTKGRHTRTFGVDIRRNQANVLSLSNGRGTFSFTANTSAPTTGYAIADLLLGYPTSTSNNPKAPLIYIRTSGFSGFIQDDWKATEKLTINLGIRWELDTPLTSANNQLANFVPQTGALVIAGQNGQAKNIYKYDFSKFQPRVGFAYSAVKNTVLRGGIGLYSTAPTSYNGIGTIYFNPPFRAPATFNSSVAAPITLNNPFPTTTSGGTVTPAGVSTGFLTPYVMQFGAGLQHQLPGGILIDASYFGSKGTHLPNAINVNQPGAGPGTTAQVNARRPFPNYGNITFFESVAYSHYDSLLLKVEKRTGFGLNILGSYTYGKSLDDSSGEGASSSDSSSNQPQNSSNINAEYGRSDFDIRHRFVESTIYTLPIGKQLSANRIAKQFLGGWQISSIFTYNTGHPLTASYTGNNSNTFNNHDRPNLIGNPNSGPKTIAHYFNTAAFVAAPINTFGNAGRNLINGPGYVDLDGAVSKTFVLPREMGLQFRGEFFNALNHPNFNLPSGTFDASTFGQISSAMDPRQLQVAVRFTF